MHLADLHLGKRVNEFSMVEDQRYILNQILSIAEKKDIDALLIAGDIYDKSQPSVEAIELMDGFLTALVTLDIPVFLISGNHDSPERLDYAKEILEKNRIYIRGTYHGVIDKYELEDCFGKINIYMMPYLKPILVKLFFEEEIISYEDALRVAISKLDINTKERNVLVGHQFVIGGNEGILRSDSENISVGGMDQVHYSIFQEFDYVALGHLHAPQKIGNNKIRYAGSPLKYSASEVMQKKCVTIVHLKERDSIEIETVPLTPLRNMRSVKGPMDQIVKFGKCDIDREDYIHAYLTDQEEVYDAVGQLRNIYPNLMSISFEKDSISTVDLQPSDLISDRTEKTMLQLFSEFYFIQNREELSEENRRMIEKIIEEIGDGII